MNIRNTKSIKSLSETFFQDTPTPYFLFQKDILLTNIKSFNKFKDSGIEVLYAVKANNNPEIISELVKQGYGFDVASKEELELVLKLGADVSKISFSSPTKFDNDIEFASKVGVNMYSFDTEYEIRKILKHNPNAKLIGRVSTPNKNSIVNLSEKFGMTLDYFKYLARQANRNSYNIIGLTFHVGSQNENITSWTKALQKISEFIIYAKQNNISIETLNIGGGIPSNYEKPVKPLDYYVETISDKLLDFKKKHNLKNLYVEPGRAMVANTTDLVTSVINIKAYKKPPIIETDVSIYMGLIETLEHFSFPIVTLGEYLNMKKFKERRYYKVGGYSCSGNDIINPRVLLPKSIMNLNKLVILSAGAYTSVMQNFHMKDYPRIINI